MLHGLILYPRATCATVGPGVPPFGPKRPVATTWPSRGQPPSWGKCVRVRSIPRYPASKPTIGESPLALPSHMPTIRESDPSDHRTKRCRRGSEPIVYGSRPCNFAAEGKVAESEESRSQGLRPGFDSLQSRFGGFLLFIINSLKKNHRNTDMLSEMDRVPNRPFGAYINEGP